MPPLTALGLLLASLRGVHGTADGAYQAASGRHGDDARFEAGSRNWIERLTDSEARLSEHLEMMKKIRPAATALYAALSAEQKTKADALMPGAMGMTMGGRHGGK